MDVIEAIKERRSIRKYRPDPLPEKILQTILEAARWAPSWANTQSWRLIIVRDPLTKSKLADTLQSAREGAKNSAAEAVRTAPVVIVGCAQRGLSGSYRSGEKKGLPATDKGQWWFMFDLGLAMQNLTLAAHALGLGTVHVGMFDTAEVARMLALPENIAVVEIMSLGYPDEKPPTPSRKETGEFVFYEKFSV